MPGVLLISGEVQPFPGDIQLLIWASPLTSPGVSRPPIGKMRIIGTTPADGGFFADDFGYRYEAIFSPITIGYVIWVAAQCVSGDAQAGGFGGGIKGNLVWVRSAVID